MREDVDVCLVGGGVVGLWCAVTLAEAGHTVRMIDKEFIGASRNNIGELIQQGHGTDVLPFVRLAFDEWQTASARLGEDVGVDLCGSMMLALRPTEVEALQAQTRDEAAVGLPTRFLEGPPLAAELKRGALTPQVLGARFSDGDASVATDVALDGLNRLAVRRGVRMWGSDVVTDFLVENGRVVGARTKADEVYAKLTVLCAGPWSVNLTKTLGVPMPLRPARGHLIEISPTQALPRQLVAYPSPLGQILCKTLRSGRALVAYTGLNDQAQATWSTQPDPQAVQATLTTLAALLEGVKYAAVRHVSVVTQSVTPDGRPYLGESAQYPGLYVAMGFNGKSYAYAPAVALAVKAYLAGVEPVAPMGAFHPDRFAVKVV